MACAVNLDEQDWQCVVCREQYDMDNRSPMLLSCGHSVCKSCVSTGHMRDPRTHTTKCPLCRALHISPGASQSKPEKIPENHTMKMLLGKMGINKRRRDEQKETEEAPPSQVPRISHHAALMSCLQDILDGADLTDRERLFYPRHWREAHMYVDTRYSKTLSDVVWRTFARPSSGVNAQVIRIEPELRDRFCQDYVMLVGRSLRSTSPERELTQGVFTVVHPFLERARLPDLPFQDIAMDALHQRIGTGCRVKRLDPNEKAGTVFVTSPSEMDLVLRDLQAMNLSNPSLMLNEVKGGVYVSYP